MNIERKRMEAWTNGKESYGLIRLDKIAIPEKVKVTLLGKELIPKAFNAAGSPIFTEEQSDLFRYKEEEFNRKKEKFTPLEAVVIYEEKVFDVPKSSFNTRQGILKSLYNLYDLNEMLNNRALYLKSHKGQRLKEFVIFGSYYLDQFGQIMRIEKNIRSRMYQLYSMGRVEHFETFCGNNKNFKMYIGRIPEQDSVCPCCGKQFTIDDVKNNSYTYIEGTFYHESCWKEYRQLTEVDKFTRRMMNIVYEKTDYDFELLPNGYCDQECCANIPWFLFHTIDGDIIMGWRKRVISIEWQENYKPFNMKELFGQEDVTKWEEDGKRGIHAWGTEKAYEYLCKVRDAVNLNYKNR